MDSPDKPTNTFDKLSKTLFGANYDDIVKHTPMPSNPFVNSKDLPLKTNWLTFFCFHGAWLGFFAWFLYSHYEQGVSNSFISLNPSAGVCKSSPGSNQCCQVPISLTGNFLADTSGYWNTETGFVYTHSLYGMTTAGLSYTNEQFQQAIINIASQLSLIGQRALYRDYSWNIIALSSFVAANFKLGTLLFYSTGNAGIIYDKTIYGINMGSGEANCDFDWTTTYSPSTSSLSIEFNLNVSLGDGYYNCPYGSSCLNPCPNAVSLNTFGYDSSRSANTLSVTFQMSSVVTAVSVNLGLTNLSSLVEVKNDNARIDLFNRMNVTHTIPILSNSSSYYFSSYYDVLYAPMDPIYCITFYDIQNSQCFIRIGNTLVYPMTSSWGYYSNSSSFYPKQCTKQAASKNPGKYYCNLMDVVIGFIYYTNTDCDEVTSYYYRRSLHESHVDKELLNYYYNPFQSSTNSPTSDPTSDPTYAPVDYAYAASNPTNDPTDSPTYYSKTNYYSTNYPYENYSTNYYQNYNFYDFYGSENFTYSSYSYSSFAYTDDFQPFQSVCYDNGIIFEFARAVALVYYNHSESSSSSKNSINGDTFVVNLAYEALIDTLTDSYGYNAFQTLCNGTNSVLGQVIPGNCGLMAIEFYGGDDLHISEYYYQPTSIAYSDSIYNMGVLNKLALNPPTRLIQPYYDCVLAPSSAFFTATGLAFSNATLYTSVAFLVFVITILICLRYFYKLTITTKLQAEIENEKLQNTNNELLQYLKSLKEFNTLERLEALNKDILLKNNTEFSNFSQVAIKEEIKLKDININQIQTFEIEMKESILNRNKVVSSKAEVEFGVPRVISSKQTNDSIVENVDNPIINHLSKGNDKV